MTTYYNFTPSNAGPFSFQPTFDGNIYNVVVTWSLFGQRYYVNIYNLSGDLVVALPVIGSAVGVNVSGIAWANGLVKVTTALPHGYLIGATTDLTITGTAPSAYSGTFSCFIIDDVTFQFSLASDPGSATVPGTVFYNVSMTAGYFDSTLVFRPATQQFEVSP